MNELTNETTPINYYKKMITLGLPIVFQHLVSTSLNMIDTMMISQKGDVAIASVGIANKFFFIMIVILFGVYSGASIFISQYYGVKDKDNIHKATVISIYLGLILGLIFTLIARVFPSQIMDLFIDDNEVIASGATYLRIVCFSYIPMALSFAISNASRNVHKTLTPMVSSIIGLILNTLLNYLLINGNLGFPDLGVKGAAIATVIARSFELLLLIVLIYSDKDSFIKINFRDLLSFDIPLFNKIWHKIIPVILNETAWVVGTTLYFVAYGKLGTESVVAVQISNTIVDLSWALFQGLGGASALLIGNEIGRKGYDNAYKYASKSLKIGVISALFVSGLFILTNGFIIQLFNLSGSTALLAKKCILVMALVLPIRAFNYTMFISVLRSGGDATYCMVVESTSIWLIGVPSTFLAVYFLPVTIPILLLISYFEEIVKAFIVFHRFKTKKWINNLITN